MASDTVRVRFVPTFTKTKPANATAWARLRDGWYFYWKPARDRDRKWLENG